MMRIGAFGVVLALAVRGYSQVLTVVPSSIPGIELVGPQSADFSGLVAKIVGTDQPPGFVAWLPYGLVIENHSSEAVAAMTVVWRIGVNGGPMRPGSSGSPTWFNQPQQQIKAGQAIVVLPQAVFEQPRQLRLFADGHGMGNLQNYQRADRVQAMLDGVVFASGQFVGGDSVSEYTEFQARISAPRSVAEAVLQRRKTESIADVLAWLQGLADHRRSDDPRPAVRGALANLHGQVFDAVPQVVFEVLLGCDTVACHAVVVAANVHQVLASNATRTASPAA